MTPLDKSLKRALTINGRVYVVTLAPDALKITEKGHRIGVELKWADLVSGESALAVALQASVGKFQGSTEPRVRKTKPISLPRKNVQTTSNARRSIGKGSAPPKRSR
jgi:hypothetical protein